MELNRPPRQKPLNVYLAGKIGLNDWRHKIFPGLRDAVPYELGVRAQMYQMEPVDGFSFVGPYFVSCDHGCGHGDATHGWGLTGKGCFDKSPYLRSDTRRLLVSDTCLRGINRASYVFCWIEDLTAFGTLFELGYARAKRKRTFIGMKAPGSQFSQELWLSLVQSEKRVVAKDPLEAWESFKKWIDSIEGPASSPA